MEEEIKLIIILILTFCTFLKVRNTRTLLNTNYNHKSNSSNNRHAIQPSSDIDQEDFSLNQVFDPEVVALNDSLLFPQTPPRPFIVNSQTPSKVDAYRKSFAGVTLEQDPANHYCSRSIDPNPFLTSRRRVVRSNDECLSEIQHLLVESFIPQPQPIMPMPTFLQSPMPIPSPIPIPSPMIDEDEESTPLYQKASLLKRKNIAKDRKFSKKQKKQSQAKPIQAPLFSRLPLQTLKKRRKEQSLVNIDKQIEKRYEQIRVLERLRQQSKKIAGNL